MYPKLKSVECISFSCDRSLLAISGRDEKNKENIIIYNVCELNSSAKPIQITKQISNFNIIAMKFSPIDPFVLMSCGRENIRCWRLKNKHLQGASIVLDHRARNTIFTDLDYEFGFKSSDLVENESLSRILVSSKTGLILIINYHTKKLENAFQIHDGPIQSISVNEAFCVTGSEDHLLRVWLLDFSEYFIEAPHDGTVSAVDISPDGTQIVCGTANGSLGIVDIAQEKYVTLLRSHSDEIISADYNQERNYIITVSKDKTIRLWGVDGNFQKIYEFVSPNDQAISVSSHPTLPLFACGFESGTLRIFDIERTKVCEVYSQFNLPLCDLVYSSDERLLLTAAKDGYLALHNVKLQHQPIKMISIDFPPPHVCVAFDPTNSVFAAFGDNGNIINIYDTVNFSQQSQVSIKKDVGKCFVFSPSKLELIVATTSCKIKIYDLKYKDSSVPLREITNVHRDSINSINFSMNGMYFITCGNDKTVKVFDSDIDNITPYYFQSSIGHTFPVGKVFFNPRNNSQCISIGGRDGIHLWKFNGETSSYDAPEQDLIDLKKRTQERLTFKGEIHTELPQEEGEREDEETSKQDQPQPSYEQQEQDQAVDISDQDKENINQENQSVDPVSQDRDSHKDYKQYTETGLEQESCDYKEGEGEVESVIKEEEENTYTYNGMNAQDNLVWVKELNAMIYSSDNHIVIDDREKGSQSIVENGHETEISALAITNDNKILASCAATADENETAPIIIWDIDNDFEKKYELRSHEIGVKNLLFSNDGAFLISQGCNEERSLVLWDVEEGIVIKSTICPVAYSGITLIDSSDSKLMFATVGNQAYRLWKLDNNHELLYFDVDLPENDLNLTAVSSTSMLGEPYNSSVVLIGTIEGDVVINNPDNGQYLAKINSVMSGAITLIE